MCLYLPATYVSTALLFLSCFPTTMSVVSTTTVPHQDSAMRQRPIGDMLSQQFAPFDHRSKVVAPFDDETKRDAAFIESEYMLDRVIVSFS